MDKQIGTIAGNVWHYLETSGEVTTAKLSREINATRDMVQRAIGWLAREDKVNLRKDKNGEKIWLKH